MRLHDDVPGEEQGFSGHLVALRLLVQQRLEEVVGDLVHFDVFEIQGGACHSDTVLHDYGKRRSIADANIGYSWNVRAARRPQAWKILRQIGPQFPSLPLLAHHLNRNRERLLGDSIDGHSRIELQVLRDARDAEDHALVVDVLVTHRL